MSNKSFIVRDFVLRAMLYTIISSPITTDVRYSSNTAQNNVIENMRAINHW